MSNYTQAPPSYQPAPSGPSKYGSTNEAAEPLLSNESRGESSRGMGMGGVYNQPNEGDLPDDFKYGVSASESAPEIRNAFIRKVYSILFVQLLGTCVIGGFASTDTAVQWVQAHQWAVFIPIFGSLISLGFLWWKRHSHPLNFVLLGTFTILESLSLGLIVAVYDQTIVLQALIITMGVFLGLTLFTLQSKYDFSGMAPFLFGGLMVLFMTGLVGIFIPFSETMDLIYAVGGTLLFSGYIVYDTYMITKRLSPDEFIVGAVSLYLDVINLFLSILRLLNNVENR